MRRARTATAAPCADRARAVASPIPLEAPVTTAVRPVSVCSVMTPSSAPRPPDPPTPADPWTGPWTDPSRTRGGPRTQVRRDGLGCARGHEESGGNPEQSRYCDRPPDESRRGREPDPKVRFHPIEQGRSHP
ncbi:hypothetical protein GCM10009562_24780 [Nocardioides aquaticus]